MPSQILYGEYEPQASILCELITRPFLINTSSMKQPDLYYFETIKMTSQGLVKFYIENTSHRRVFSMNSVPHLF